MTESASAPTDSIYSSLVAGAEVIERDPYGDKVLKLQDGNFLKLFRRKRLITTAIISPPEKRFMTNCETLEKRGIPSPKALQLFKFSNPDRGAILYSPLPGHTLRGYIPTQSPEQQEILLRKLASFIAHLHDKGIYFRSLHMGNIILTESGDYGLIDISDMQISLRSLSKAKRKRNFKHLLRYKKDLRLIKKIGLAPFFAQYNQSTAVKLNADDIIAEYEQVNV